MAKSKNRGNPESLTRAYDFIDKSVKFHQAFMCGDISDEVVWDGPIFKESGGIKILEEMLSCETSSKKKQELQEQLSYWKENYADIRKRVYQVN